MTKVRLTEYEIDRCGYFEASGTHVTGSFGELVADLNDWLPDRPLAVTRTFVASGSDGSAMAVFAAGWAFDPKTLLACLVLWCEVSSVDGNVLSIDPSATVGSRIAPHRNAIRDGEVPGYPAYFILDAKRARYFTLRIESGPVAPKQMYMYCEGFLQHYGSRVESEHDADITEIVLNGTHVDGNDVPRENLRARFAAHPKREPSSISFLKRNARKVFKVERKLKLGGLSRNESDSFLTTARRWMGLPTTDDTVDDALNFRYSMLVDVEATDIEAMIDSLPQDADDTWSDLGFYLRGRPNPVWARRALRAADVAVEIDGTRDSEVLDPAEVLQKLSAHLPR